MGSAASVLSAPEGEQIEAITLPGHEEYIGWPLASVGDVIDKYEKLSLLEGEQLELRVHLAGTAAELEHLGATLLAEECRERGLADGGDARELAKRLYPKLTCPACIANAKARTKFRPLQLLRSEWFEVFSDYTTDRGDGTFLRLSLDEFERHIVLHDAVHDFARAQPPCAPRPLTCARQIPAAWLL